MKFKDQEMGGSGRGKFLRLNPNDTIKVIFRGEIYAYFVQWNNGKSTVVPESALGSKRKYRVNAIINDQGNYTAKIYEFGPSVYQEMMFIDKATGDIENQIVAIGRIGAGLNTEYKVQNLGPVPANVKATLDKIELNKLDFDKVKDSRDLPTPIDNSPEDIGNMPAFEDIPF